MCGMSSFFPGRPPAGGPIGRRRFLLATGGLGAGVLLGACSTGAATAVGPDSPRVLERERDRQTAGQRLVELRLEAVPGEVDLGGQIVSTWSYGGEVPGREIRVSRGDLLRVDLQNDLPQSTTVHWHGP